jgi:hypothetical protein
VNLPTWLVFLAVVPPLILCVWYVIRADRLGRYQALALIVAFIYGLTVEALALHTSHAYDYANWWLMWGSRPDWVPFAICASWAVIMYVVMRTSDALELPWWQRPLFDGAAAMTLDLVLDPVMSATKLVPNSLQHCMDVSSPSLGGLSLWTWCVDTTVHTPLWFTVPVSNFVGWGLVVMMFSLMVRLGAHFGKPETRRSGVQFVMLLVLAALALGGCALIGPPIDSHFANGPDWLANATLAFIVAIPFLLVISQAKTLNFRNAFPAWRLAWPAYDYLCWGSLFFILKLDGGGWPGAAFLMVATILVSALVFLLPYIGTITNPQQTPAA